MICKINNIVDEVHPVYFKRKLIGNVTYLQFLDLRLQIRNSGEEGWEIEFNGQFYEINKYGVVQDHWPVGLFDQHDYYLSSLLRKVGSPT